MTQQQNERRRQVLRLAAEKAFGLPLLESGFWTHGDLRDNLYYALHLYAACTDESLELRFPRESGLKLAQDMLLRVLSLQVQDPADPGFGHWPLGLGKDPATAPANTLPVELLGSMLAWFHSQYAAGMDRELDLAFQESMRCAYLGNWYRKNVDPFSHHESKYTAQQLIWGELFRDAELAETGRRNLKRMLDTVRANGMREYGALPWFWHWVQAFTFARELVREQESIELLDGMLDYLWRVRASVYLKGAWAGPHSRVLPHDIPADRNSLIDYVMFGDFPMPSDILRLEAAGLVMPRVEESVIASAVNRQGVSEVKRLIPLDPEHVENGSLHACVYLTPAFAVGGVWERAEEYMNEQHRWDVTLPVSAADGRANRAFFFRPGSGYTEGDPRHQSGGTEVLLHENTVAAVYVPSADEQQSLLLGCLPLGEWQLGERLMVGACGDAYLIVHLMNPYEAMEKADRMTVRSSNAAGTHGVIIEALDAEAASARGWRSLSAVASAAAGAEPSWSAGADGTVRAEYLSLSKGDRLVLAAGADGVLERRINGAAVSFAGYSVRV
ncbi:hypothetical protein [Gorillibacterium sp. sgz5001074]|uniref:hypothetical protein n=1 Tax=Gorillibacterium sp. sgz5001074 TaxID=3446695 RepID=UPI003F67F075